MGLEAISRIYSSFCTSSLVRYYVALVLPSHHHSFNPFIQTQPLISHNLSQSINNNSTYTHINTIE